MLYIPVPIPVSSPLVVYQGYPHGDRAIKKMKVATFQAAQLALLLMNSQDPAMGVPGLWSYRGGNAVASTFRYGPTGHPTEQDRPSFATTLEMPGMGMVLPTGYGYSAMYGKRSILDAQRPMYYRSPGGAKLGRGGYGRYLVEQWGPPIWQIIEYGTQPHSIAPRADRQWMRFIWLNKNYQLTWAKRIQRHPGAFRKEGAMQSISLLAFATSAQSWKPYITSLYGSSMYKFAKSAAGSWRANEPFGLAPFRRSHAAVKARAPSLLRQAIALQGRPL